MAAGRYTFVCEGHGVRISTDNQKLAARLYSWRAHDGCTTHLHCNQRDCGGRELEKLEYIDHDLHDHPGTQHRIAG